MYAIARLPFRRPMVARRRGWWLPLFFALASLCAALVPATLSFPAPTQSRALPINLKAARPLSPRLAMLAQGQATTMRALSLPESGPGSLLTDAVGDPLVYIQLTQIDARTRMALGAAGARIMHANGRYGIVTAVVAPRWLAAVAAVPGVVSMQEALAPMVRSPRGSGTHPAVSLAVPQATPAQMVQLSPRAIRSCVPPVRASVSAWMAAG